MKKCPNCNLENPPDGLRCDCGYDFETDCMLESYCSASESINKNQTNKQRNNSFSSLVKSVKFLLILSVIFWIGVIGQFTNWDMTNSEGVFLLVPLILLLTVSFWSRLADVILIPACGLGGIWGMVIALFLLRSIILLVAALLCLSLSLLLVVSLIKSYRSRISTKATIPKKHRGKIILEVVAVVFALLGPWFISQIRWSVINKPSGEFSTFNEYMQAGRVPVQLLEARRDGQQYIVAFGPSDSWLASQPAGSAYVFNHIGTLVDWTVNVGDDSEFIKTWHQPDQRDIDLEEAEAFFAGNELESREHAAFSSLPIKKGLPRARLEQLIARTTGGKNTYNPNTMHVQKNAQYNYGNVVLSVTFVHGETNFQTDKFSNIDSTVLSWELKEN